VITQPVDYHQARSLCRSFLKQNVIMAHVDAKYDQIIEQVLFEFVEVEYKLGNRITPFEMSPQGSENSAVVIRDLIHHEALT